jgi:hypothetical protein
MSEVTQVGIDSLSTITSGQIVEVQRVQSSDYVLAHSEDMSLFYGGLVNEQGVETVQVMVDGEAARFDPDTLEFEYVSA